MLTLARLLALAVVLAAIPLLTLTLMDSYGLTVDATDLLRLRGWALGPVFSLGLALLAELWLQIPAGTTRSLVARIWWLALAGHVALVAPSLGAKITPDTTLAQALTFTWAWNHPGVALFATLQVLIPDLVAVGLIIGTGEVQRAREEEAEQDPYAGTPEELEAETLQALNTPASGGGGAFPTVPVPAVAPLPPPVETFQCDDCGKTWTKPVGKRDATLKGHAPYCKGKTS